MAHAIPKIQYKIYSFQGNTTNLNPIITGILSTTKLEVGMLVTGAGIQANSLIISKTSNSITLDKDAAATASGVLLEAKLQFEMEFPPIEKDGESIEPKERVSISNDGTRQVSIDYFERKRSFDFSFINQTLKNTFETFFLNWAAYGKSFRYFDDKTNPSYTTVELDKLDFKPKKITPKNSTDYVWSIPFAIRRVVGAIDDSVGALMTDTVVRPSSWPHAIVANTLILVDTSAPRTLNLPQPAVGLRFIIKDAIGTAAANNITLARSYGEEIENVAADKILNTNFGAWEITSDGVDWFITSF